VRHVLDAIRVRQRRLNSSGPLAEALRLSRLGRFAVAWTLLSVLLAAFWALLLLEVWR